VHRLTQKIDVIIYKITVKDTVEERILALQEKKRELANQTIEGANSNVGKLGMQEIMNLFRGDAEHMLSGSFSKNSYQQPKILNGYSSSSTDFSGTSSRGVSEPRSRKATPPTSRTKENDVYGRRW
jgi:hypothetical protein